MRRRLICTLLLLCLPLFGACGNSEKQPSDKDLLTTEDWYNVNDEDVYAFYVDGTGKHNNISLKYRYDSAAKTLTVTEGVATLSDKEYTLETTGDFVRLVAKDNRSFYVRASDYPTVAERVREENESILTDVERWKSVRSDDDATDMYTAFRPGGTGRVWLYKDLKLIVDANMTWDMIDNNTVKLYIDYEGEKYPYVLDIINDNGAYRLATQDDAVHHVPAK